MNPKEYSSEAFWNALLGEYNPVPNAKWMISTDPPDHLRLRKLANKAFLPPVKSVSLPATDWPSMAVGSPNYEVEGECGICGVLSSAWC